MKKTSLNEFMNIMRDICSSRTTMKVVGKDGASVELSDINNRHPAEILPLTTRIQFPSNIHGDPKRRNKMMHKLYTKLVESKCPDIYTGGLISSIGIQTVYGKAGSVSACIWLDPNPAYYSLIYCLVNAYIREYDEEFKRKFKTTEYRTTELGMYLFESYHYSLILTCYKILGMLEDTLRIKASNTLSVLLIMQCVLYHKVNFWIDESRDRTKEDFENILQYFNNDMIILDENLMNMSIENVMIANSIRY